MAMTPEQMVELFDEQAAGFATYIPEAIGKRDLHWAALNASEALKCRMMVGLIQWRHRFCDPTPAFRRAIYSASEAAMQLHALDSTMPVWRYFRFEAVEILKLLVGDEIDISILEEITTSEGSSETTERILDALIVLGLKQQEIDPRWNELIERLRQKKRAALAAETYGIYRAILQAGLNSDPMRTVQEAENAAKAFVRRKQNAFFSGGPQTEGGGPDNDHVVDYRLGALMKALIPEEMVSLLSTEASVHCWIWKSDFVNSKSNR